MRETHRDYGADELNLNKSSIVVDIGAHVGVVSMTLAKRYGCKVFAYEPNPDNFSRLIANIMANDLGDLITPFPVAVTGDGRCVKIGTSTDNSGGNDIYGDGVEVESVTLAQILDDVGGHIDLLKIDAEGAEYEILKDADFLGKIDVYSWRVSRTKMARRYLKDVQSKYTRHQDYPARMGRMISIVTPWLNHPELLNLYLPSVKGAEVIIVDNASDQDTAAQLQQAASIYIRNETNNRFAKASNQGIEAATCDIIVCLNNDISAHNGWLKAVEATVKPGAFYGPSVMDRKVDGVHISYIEGHCIAATKDTWQAVGLWPDDLPGMYWEDNILCLRALMNGFGLVKTDWDIKHFGNYTTRHIPDAVSHSEDNRKTFEEMFRAHRYQRNR